MTGRILCIVSFFFAQGISCANLNCSLARLSQTEHFRAAKEALKQYTNCCSDTKADCIETVKDCIQKSQREGYTLPYVCERYHPCSALTLCAIILGNNTALEELLSPFFCCSCCGFLGSLMLYSEPGCLYKLNHRLKDWSETPTQRARDAQPVVSIMEELGQDSICNSKETA